jgi:predicted nucleic acid-binding protein
MPVYTVDASVFLNAFNPAEPGHATSQHLLSRWQAAATPVVVPTLLLPEVAAAVSRGRRDGDLAARFAAALRRLPHVVWVPLDDSLAQQAAEVAARHCLRGSDAVYAAVALRFGSTLVTLDEEQRQRVANVVSACRPGDLSANDVSHPD